MISSRIPASVLSVLLAVQSANQCRSAIIVDIGTQNLNPGGVGFVDIAISSNANDPLQFYSMDLLITPLGGATSTLEFTAPQSEPHLTDLDYIFAGDTFGGGLFSVATTSTNHDTLNAAADFTLSGSDVTVPAAPGALLYRLEVKHVEDPFNLGHVGDQFQISVTGFDFEDSSFNTYTPTFNPGTVSVSAAAVPEPSSLSLMGVLATLCGVVWRCRHRVNRTG